MLPDSTTTKRKVTTMTRLTDEDLKIRHSTVHFLLAALGYIPDDSSASTIWEVQRRVKEAVAAGRIAIDSEGHYRITNEYADRQRARNQSHTRANRTFAQASRS